MNYYILLLIAGLLVGCNSLTVKQDSDTAYKLIDQDKKKEAKILETERTKRLDYLKKQAQLLNYNPKTIVEVNDVYGIMTALQEGRLTPEQFKGMMLYFKNSIGRSKYPDLYAFKCAQVIDLNDKNSKDGNKVSVYKALYSNQDINMTVSVIWGGITPLKGQLLNVDFLMYSGVDSYTNNEGESRSEVIFIRPKWAGLNGFY